MTQQMIYVNYDEKISFLQSNGERLLQTIQSLEIEINRRKQNNQQPLECELNLLFSLVKNVLEILAEIKTCQYFKLSNQLVFYNEELYKTTCNAILADLINKFFNEYHKIQLRKKN